VLFQEKPANGIVVSDDPCRPTRFPSSDHRCFFGRSRAVGKAAILKSLARNEKAGRRNDIRTVRRRTPDG